MDPMLADEELFGSPDRLALMKRSAALWSLLKDNPRYAYYGRTVALSEIGDDTADILCSLARLQGVGVAYYSPKLSAANLLATLEGRGFSTDRHEHYRGGEPAYQASRAISARRLSSTCGRMRALVALRPVSERIIHPHERSAQARRA
jgi:hypothetical protein